MIELKAKFNNAKVFTDNIDAETISQIMLLLNQEFAKDNKIRIMPDTHAGSGCVIGTTMTIKDKIVPNLVGVDIGCGMHAVKLKEKEIDLSALDEVIEKYIPSGANIHELMASPYDLDDIIAPIDKERARRSIGTLGGGNHFIEVNRDSEGYLWLVIHTGSRHLGIEICKHYQDLAYKTLKGRGDVVKDIIEKLKAEGRQREIESATKTIKEKEITIPKDLCYLEGDNFKNYIHDMNLAQKYALTNRMHIADGIMRLLFLHEEERFDTIHNYIDIDNMILRKGAISAQAGEKVIIPMNMRDGSLICVGKGNPDWNYSAPHGAGRVMSRSKAKETINMHDFKDSMKDIYSTSVVESTIDEAPMAYKPMDEIIENIKDTVDVIDIIKPIYNFKAH